MSPTAWFEIAFNIGYLIVVWSFVVAMTRGLRRVPEARRNVASRVRLAFLLLALGDTGHVGARAVTLASGDLEAHANWFGLDIPMVGIGALATAITVTFFYAAMLDAWRERFSATRGPIYWALASMVPIRLALFVSDRNQWSNVIPPFEWSLLRNVPLMVLGLGTAALILRNARAVHDKPFLHTGILILVSYAFYFPVILLVQRMTAIGMLMVPKTLAYLGMAVVLYRGLWGAPSKEAALANA